MDDQSLFMLQFIKDGDLQYIERIYENKSKKRHYLFTFNGNDGSYSYYFQMKKTIEEEDKK